MQLKRNHVFISALVFTVAFGASAHGSTRASCIEIGVAQALADDQGGGDDGADNGSDNGVDDGSDDSSADEGGIESTGNPTADAIGRSIENGAIRGGVDPGVAAAMGQAGAQATANALANGASLTGSATLSNGQSMVDPDAAVTQALEAAGAVGRANGVDLNAGSPANQGIIDGMVATLSGN